MSPENYSYATGIFISSNAQRKLMKLNKLVSYISLSHAETNEGN